MVFICNHCPTAQAYEDRIARLHADYKGKGVALVAISPNDPGAVRLDELAARDAGGRKQHLGGPLGKLGEQAHR